jgi:hypothetical protein
MESAQAFCSEHATAPRLRNSLIPVASVRVAPPRMSRFRDNK